MTDSPTSPGGGAPSDVPPKSTSEPRLPPVPALVPDGLVAFDTNALPHETVDVLVLGAGVAGLSAALAAASARARVLVLSKGELAESNTFLAQGGIAMALGDPARDLAVPDTEAVEAHVADTLSAGAGLCDEAIVRDIVREGPLRLAPLVRGGAAFDSTPDGRLAVTREGGHSRARVLHAGGDATGRELARTLAGLAFNLDRLRLYERAFAIDLLIGDDGRCLGVLYERGGERRVVWAGAVVLATGGAGRLFRETTNSRVATGDGLAIAYRAGATLRDLEFMQFHPTTLYVAGSARVLITEAVRGEGGVLRNREGERFMPAYHPLADLAPRDIVSRAIIDQMIATGDTNAYLDVTHLDQAFLAKRFPVFARTCERFGIALSREWVPVRPTAHYMIGGASIDRDGRTSVPGLFAAGECTSSGLHGANRLASNSLLEGLVIGHRAGVLAAAEARVPAQQPRVTAHGPAQSGAPNGPAAFDVADLTNALTALLWQHLGVRRSADGLAEGTRRLASWARYALTAAFTTRAGWELQNQLTLAAPMFAAAHWRCESRGVHFREDFPEPRGSFAHHHEIARRPPA